MSSIAGVYVPVARSYTYMYVYLTSFRLFPSYIENLGAENCYGFRHMLSVLMWPVQRARFRQPTFFPPQSSDRDVRRAKATVYLRPPPPSPPSPPVPRSVHNLRRGSRSRTPSLLLSQLRISRRLSSRWLPVPPHVIPYCSAALRFGLASSSLTSEALLLNSIPFLHTRLTVTYLSVSNPPPSPLTSPPPQTRHLSLPTLAAIGPSLPAFLISFDSFLSAHRNLLKTYNLLRFLWSQAGTKLSGTMALFYVKNL